jgi:hypothetical protein
MGHRAIAIVVEGRRARAYEDHWAGARMLDVMLGDGPAALGDAIAGLEEIEAIGEPFWWEAGVLVDRRRKRVVWFGDPTSGYIGDAPGAAATDDAAWVLELERRWAGFVCERVEGAEAFDAYLAEHRVKLPRVVSDLDLAPDDSDAGDAGDAVDTGGDERRARLFAEEEGAPRAPRSAETRGGERKLAPYLIMVLVVPAALLTRLLSWPFRASIRARAAWRAREERAAAQAARRVALTRANERLAVAPDDVGARIDRAMLLPPAAAEREFDACIAALEAAPETSENRRLLAVAFYDRGVMRARLRLPNLAAIDQERARALGHVPHRQGALRAFFGLAFVVFLALAGLEPEDG